MGSFKVSPTDKSFPPALKNIASPPKQLYVLGELEQLLNSRVVSIVGSRAVTPYGRQVTTKLAGELAGKGITIVSGLAIGVDALAHQAALEAGGYTVAVLPSSVDHVYPASNQQLAQRIIDSGGALISEYDGPIESYKSNFIARNRLVSGLADVLLITEASDHSGTLHTANFALEQGKTVMAVPGNITSANSVGTNRLIKAGALPVTEASDVLQALGITQKTSDQAVVAANSDEALILDQLSQGVSDVAELQQTSGLSAEKFNQVLTMLEITGKIHPLGNGHWGLN
ncbi:MAG TPA: DNA-processing protein DprA [Candidatus Saccharimonadales bacterium]|nr:DNA-processing protein DprA [Candidatus Saccharimonadales bacterium]